MYDPLGLSIGTTNLVVARDGVRPLRRRAVLTLFPDGASEIGLPADNPDRTERLNPGTVIDGFVEGVGRGPNPIEQQGAHNPYALLADALDAMISVSGIDATWSEIAIAVPAHWDGAVLSAVRDALKAHAGFGRRSVTPRLVSDAVAALAALSTAVDLPNRGVVGLLDFGGGGTSITLTDAGLGFQPLAETVRYQNFSGDRIDRAVLRHVLNDLGCADDIDVLSSLVHECQQAKERLSATAVTALVAELPQRCCGVRLTRDELDGLIDDQLIGVISAFDDILARHKVARANLAAVALVGGGASIPLVFQRFSSYAQVPVLTVRQPAFAMANGAALLAARGSLADVPTLAAYALAGAALGPPSRPIDDVESALPDLAWSQDADTSGDLTRYAGRFYSDVAVAPAPYSSETESTDWPPPGRNRLPQLLVGLSALVAMVAIGSAAYTLTSATSSDVSTVPSAPSKASVSMTAVNPVLSSPPASAGLVSSVSAVPPPSAGSVSSSAIPPTTVATTTSPPSSAMPSTTPPPTTTATTPSRTPSPTATAEPTSTAPASLETPVPMTTQWLRVPLLPVPIPVPVPVPQGVGG